MALLLALSSPAGAQSRRGELRGVCIGAEYGRDWTAVMQLLSDNGFNAVFANFGTGAVAYYPSQVLSPADASRTGDDLAAAASAARERGLELHVWRISWALHGASPEIVAELEAAGRLQRDHLGKPGRDDPAVGVDWLCPSHPENRRIEKEAALELVRRYDIAGILLDHMRFPGAGYCFCDGCKAQFEEATGAHVENWPADVRGDGPLTQRWRQWRRDLLTDLAGEISEEAGRLKPDICVSLAAWPDLNAARDALAQDWPTWVRQGLLDFVCPTDYTEDEDELERMLHEQVAATSGEVPLYAGLGAHEIESVSDLTRQVQATRRAGADGFVAFSYDSGEFAQWLPHLRSTVAAADPSPMPHRSPPASFTFSGPAMESPAGDGKALASATLEAEIKVGWGPPPIDETSGAGAAEAEAMLRRMMDTQSPVESYDEPPFLPGSLEASERISGRIVAEDPAGRARLVIGAFDTDSRFARTTRFPVPEGPFRVAIYGSVKAGGEEPRDYVVRSPLLVGAAAEELQAEALHAELDRLSRDVCGRAEVQQLADLALALQVEATGPGGGQWWLRLKDGDCDSGAGTVENPDLTLTVAAEDLLAIARKEADPRALWGAGRLKASGDLSLLRRLGKAAVGVES
jgi:uncharacterized lipoprotein YddW (UPF0748 family)